jgi:HTH-type transcriptional regulator/antitoxin HigA
MYKRPRDPLVPSENDQTILVKEAPLSLLGEMLIAARKARGWSQRKFALESGFNQVVIARWEVDKYRGIGLERAIQVARILGLNVTITAELGEISESAPTEG